MDTFFRFLYEFLSQFFNGIKYAFEGIAKGFITMFSFGEYGRIIEEYKNDLSVPEWLLVGLAIFFLILE